MKLPNGIPVLRAIRANKAPMTRSAIAAAIGTETKNLAGTLRTLAAMGLVCDVERVPPRPTYAPLVGLTDAGSVAADTGVLPKAPKPVKAPAKRKAKPSPVPAVVARVLSCFDDPPVPVKPKGPDPRLAHRAPVPDPPKREEPAPVSGVRVMVPPSLARRGGIQHPPPPLPAERPANKSKSDWFREVSVPPSYLHDACARGVA